ncbi:hypothetical protein ANANG_G00106970 [Anguilla anguilla]|uniref:Uncharacterized protein n=1 Tax=Anguilla anguilla TaxID=7936 RepID=A0A9D3MK45_ANGAN|nr:hypothetical protein ANANG_G00106970 [Anguilla anguilla]
MTILANFHTADVPPIIYCPCHRRITREEGKLIFTNSLTTTWLMQGSGFTPDLSPHIS